MAEVDEYIIEIDFEKGSEKPERIFIAMAELINTFQEIDKTLAKSFSINIEPVLVLHDIQSGSIRAVLCSILKDIDDEPLMNLDWKKIIGKFIVKAKYMLIKFLEDKDQITSIEPIKELENKLSELAFETNAQVIPSYTKVPTKKLLDNIYDLSKATYNLNKNDKALLISSEGKAIINKNILITEETTKELLKTITYTQQLVVTLLIKKPDF